jgi:hypothetical protein
MFQTVHVCFTARCIVALCVGFIFLLMCNEFCTSKADDTGSGCLNEEQKKIMSVDYSVTLLYILRYFVRH